jgi:hypothetical protein
VVWAVVDCPEGRFQNTGRAMKGAIRTLNVSNVPFKAPAMS